MQYRNLGRSGLKVSELSFGCWVTFDAQLDTKLAESCMTAAYDAGVNFFDNAETYANGQSELIMGRVLQSVAWPRSSYIVSSKVFFGSLSQPKPNQRGLSRKHLVEACHDALKRLQVDYLDLYFCHRPDPETPIEEVVFTMHTLIEQGKILYWGTSEWPAAKILEAHRIAEANHLIGPTMEQPEYNMLHRERVEKEYLGLYREIGLGTTIWSPLASGLLTGKYNDSIPKDSRMALRGYEWLKNLVESPDGKKKIAKVRSLAPVADSVGMSLAQLALAWCLRNPNVSTVITGASRREQVAENMKVSESQKNLTGDAIAEIEKILDSE